MTSNYLLLSTDYTVFNALTWGNCLNHYHKARASTTSCSQRLFHGAIALIELTPIISQITSLFEMAIASLFKPSPELTASDRREKQPVPLRQPSLKRRVLTPSGASYLASVKIPSSQLRRTPLSSVTSPESPVTRPHQHRLTASSKASRQPLVTLPSSQLRRTPLSSVTSPESPVTRPHQHRLTASSKASRQPRAAPLAPPPSAVVDITLPTETLKLQNALFLLHRQIEKQYSAMPWPAKIQKIMVVTEIRGGRGDIAAAAKAIGVLQKICPTLTFDWVFNGLSEKYDPLSFLQCEDPSKVNIRSLRSEPLENAPCDLLLAGPIRFGWTVDFCERLTGRKITGPAFGFVETGDILRSFTYPTAEAIVREAAADDSLETIYQQLHPRIFLPKSDNCEGLLPMWLKTGSGVLLDESRLDAPLSRGYCCPSYLPQIQDADLRKDVLEAMNVFDEESPPNYDQHSFNSGYAHHSASWGKFIDCVAIHEKTKNIVIVLNQAGEFASSQLSTQKFQNQIFTPERLAYLKEKGIGSVVLKGQESEGITLQEAENPHSERRLTVIVRPSFNPNDMRLLQLASERLLATGDNSAVESWCARCKLYLYEAVRNLSRKVTFLEQQVELAQTISPNLSKLLNLFGMGRTHPDSDSNTPLSRAQMDEIEELLNDPNLTDATLQFCEQITSNYSFSPVLESALKRTVWHHLIPELAQIEAEALDESYRAGIVNYFKNPETSEKSLTVRNIPELGKRVQERVQHYLSTQTNLP